MENSVGQGDNRHAPANTPGIRHIAFAIKDIDAVVAGLRARGAELVGELERYEDSYLCYVRGPEGIIIELVSELIDGKPLRDEMPAMAQAVAACRTDQSCT